MSAVAEIRLLRRAGRALARLRPLIGSGALVAGAVMLIALVAIAVIGPLIDRTNATSTAFAPLQAPSARHLFGTDTEGRDVLIRVIDAIGLDLAIAGGIAALATVCGTVAGLVSGYAGGLLDLVIMRLVDIMMSTPAFILALITAVALGNTVRTLVLALAFAYTPVMVRLVRSQALYLRELAMVETSIAIGAPRWRIVVSHILPNAYSVLTAQATLFLAWAILDTAAMSFIGVGVHPPTAELGAMISDGTQDIVSGQWWTTVFPGLFIVLLVVSFNLVGDGLRDLLDPRH
jgi:peptide/nickel transport system permease protein